MSKKNSETKLTNEQVAIRVSVVTLCINIVLTAFKVMAGVLAHSHAMISDAVHSASDVFSTIIVMVGVKMGNHASDKEHPYGHERLESVASLFLCILLAITGVGIAVTGVKNILSGETLAAPGTLALIAAVISILCKEGCYWYTILPARRIDSTVLKADAWHHRSDAFSSIGSLIGIWGARMGYPILDPIAGIVISLFILKAAWDILRQALAQMTDHACDDNTIAALQDTILSVEGVLHIDSISTRQFGDRAYVDIEVALDGSQTLYSAHHIAQVCHDRVETGFPKVKHCMVHMNPAQAGDDNKAIDTTREES